MALLAAPVAFAPYSPVLPVYSDPFASSEAALLRLAAPAQPLMPQAPLSNPQTMTTQLLLMLTECLAELMLGSPPRNESGGSGTSAGVGSSSLGGSSTSLETPTGKVGDFIKTAEAQQGKPYVFGATGPNAFDCSGLVDYALNQAGVKVPRLTADGYMQRFKDNKVDKNDLKPGDLIYYNYDNDRGIGAGHASHIEIYIGNGMTVGAEGTKAGIRTQKINWAHFLCAERVPGLYE